ncbi:WSCD family member GA21586-like [Amphibalanus amphitrite]|uniref:WSCD family member GA21586-like n=1 Tax=Amphibalanus amphitrite TaxID=1232801 RepID=UPI001C8FD076|nr:WSCD family member GA21586-like [Amphibalanus amphitrite]
MAMFAHFPTLNPSCQKNAGKANEEVRMFRNCCPVSSFPSNAKSSAALVSVAVCCLVAVTRPRAVPLAAPADTDGRIGGRPIAELWVPSRPAHAWFTNAQCRPLLTRFTCDQCLPLVYLASFPRSGNTWLRYLLEASTGLVTTNGHPDFRTYRNQTSDGIILNEEQLWTWPVGNKELMNYGYVGERIPWSQGVGIVSKTHMLPEPWSRAEAENAPHALSPFPETVPRRAVLLIRDPFKAVISLRKYGETQSILNEKDMSYLFRGKGWRNYSSYLSRVWFKTNTQWLQATNETHVVLYERLRQDPMGELRALLRFLQVEPDRRRLECLRGELEGIAHNHRHGVVPDGETYPLRVRAELWSYIHQLHWLLRDRGYPGLPLQQYSFADEFSEINIRTH